MTTTPRALYEVGPDHDEMLAWADLHRSQVRSTFIKWLLSKHSRLRVFVEGDDVANTVGKYTALKLHIRYLRAAGINMSDSPEDILARRFTRRVLCHHLDGIRFSRVTPTI